MELILLATAGPHEGRTIVLRQGQAAKVGRTEWADFALPLDGFMSSAHFSVECTGEGCRLADLQSANGTWLNGRKVTDAVLADGDRIVAGHTHFAVSISPGASLPGRLGATAGLSGSASEMPAPGATAGLPSSASEIPAQTDRSLPNERRPAPLEAAVPGIGAAYRAALADDVPAVRRAALLAAAWTRQPWLTAYCRQAADRPASEHFEAIRLLAILGGPDDLERILAVGRASRLGARRFQALGAFGHPGVVDLLLRAIGDDDARTAVAAGAAFVKITGAEIDSDRLVALPPEEGDQPDEVEGGSPGEFDEDFPEEAWLPSEELARRHWEDVKDRLAGSTRLCRGIDLSQGVDDEILARLDMRSRWEACLRGRYNGTWHGRAADLAAFPPRRVR